ncbi:MAG: hypothetical protein C6W56_08400 [Caldibacillus debilis]|nr:MAG: hypothetical protein C6W56_08400 [Caldibacillus debilis]
MVDQEFASAAYVPKPIRGCPATVANGKEGQQPDSIEPVVQKSSGQKRNKKRRESSWFFSRRQNQAEKRGSDVHAR